MREPQSWDRGQGARRSVLYLMDYVITFYKLLLPHPASYRFITPYRPLLYHILQAIALSHLQVMLYHTLVYLILRSSSKVQL
jgi:hypothetical protein